MARVKICPVCQQSNSPDLPFCSCGFSLADVDISSTKTAPAVSEIARQPEAICCEADMAPEPLVRTDERSGFVLIFPWGNVEVVDTLFVGRDEDLSPLAQQIIQAGLQWVSGKHAEIYEEEGRLYVRDMGSKNGTYVNGQMIDTRPIALADGDQLGFSRRLSATVRSK